MKNTNNTNINGESEINTQDFFPGKSSISAPFAGKSSNQFSPKENANLLSTENTYSFKNTNSPFRTAKRGNSMQMDSQINNNFLSRDSNTNINFNSENNYNNNNTLNPNHNLNRNINVKHNFNLIDNDQKLIKSKFKNQSELSVSLNFLRGKKLKQSDISSPLQGKNGLKTSKFNLSTNSHNINIFKNFSNTAANLNNNHYKNNNNNINFKEDNFTQNPFAKFFKKPWSFRVDEFEEINQLENNAVNKKNKAYAQHRFFGNTVSGPNLGFTPIKLKAVEGAEINSNQRNDNFSFNKKNHIKKNLYLDDIEKVTLVGDKEELIKKYVLPGIKYMNPDERKKLNSYDVDDETEKFVINKGHTIFLSDLLKSDVNLNEHSAVSKTRKSPEKHYDPRKTEIDVSDTKYGMYPKFLMRTSSFVRYINSSSADKNNLEDPNNPNYNKNEDNAVNSFGRTLVPKKLNFKNTFNLYRKNTFDNNKNNINLICSSDNIKTDIEEGQNIAGKSLNQQMLKSSASIRKQINNEGAYSNNQNFNLKSNAPKATKNSKDSSIGFNYKTTNLNSNSSLININYASPVNSPKLNNIKSSSEFITNYNSNFNYSTKNYFDAKNNLIQKSTKKISAATCYLNNQGYEINANRSAQSLSKTNKRLVVLDYPQIKFPIQPYKPLIPKEKKDIKYLTNASMVDDLGTIKKIKEVNEQVASSFQNEKEVLIMNEMSQNIDKLNVIENKINNLIRDSKLTMKHNRAYRKFNSYSSIEIIK